MKTNEELNALNEKNEVKDSELKNITGGMLDGTDEQGHYNPNFELKLIDHCEKELPDSELKNVTGGMLGAAPKLPAAQLGDNCYNGMFDVPDNTHPYAPHFYHVNAKADGKED